MQGFPFGGLVAHCRWAVFAVPWMKGRDESMRTIEIPPKPSSLVESLRDVGYSLGTALADIIDNSLTARARTIHIFANAPGGEAAIGILDDGVGLSESELVEAMRLGSRGPLEERDQSDLGRFGLGLKTASFSQCRVLTVVTRADGTTAAARWDLDHIVERDSWEVQLPDDLASIPWADRIGDRGTLVVWQRLRGAEDQRPAGENDPDLVRQLDEACSHLELVFHRFLSGEPGRRRVNILLNNRPLEPLDPFHANHPATIVGPQERLRVGQGYVTVQPFTLPHRARVTLAEWERHAGTQGYLRNQGFYVYRERRLIIHGTWFGLARQTELTKLARVRIDIPNSLDAAWRIDVKKGSAQLPPSVRQRLMAIIEPLGAPSKEVFTRRGRRLMEQNRIPVWRRIQNKDEVAYRINHKHPMIEDFMSRLGPRERDDFLRIIEVTGASLPVDALLADLGGLADSVIGNPTSDEALTYAVQTTFDHLIRTTNTKDEVFTIMQVAEPFRSNWERTEEILRRGWEGGVGP